MLINAESCSIGGRGAGATRECQTWPLGSPGAERWRWLRRRPEPAPSPIFHHQHEIIPLFIISMTMKEFRALDISGFFSKNKYKFDVNKEEGKEREKRKRNGKRIGGSFHFSIFSFGFF